MADKEFTVNDKDFTEPYKVSLPEGTPKAEVYKIARAHAQALGMIKEPTPSVPAGGGMQPEIEAPDLNAPASSGVFDELKPNNGKGIAADIATSGVLGGAMGAVTPEVVKGIGAGLIRTKNPYAVGTGLGLEVAGQAMETHRLGLTAEGVLSGLASEGAGQLADTTEFGKEHPSLGITARVAGGVGAGGILQGLEHMASGAASWMMKVVAKTAGGNTAKDATVEAAKANLKILNKNLPKQEINELMAKGSQATLATAQKKADQIIVQAAENAKPLLEKNKPAALKLLDEGDRQAAALKQAAKDRADAMTIASNGKTATATRVRAMSDYARENTIAPSKELTDIGEELRQGIQQTHGELYAARKANDAVLREARDKVVAQKVTAGQEISNMPDLKALRDELERDARLTQAGKVASKGRAMVTDPATVRAYRDLHEALTPKGAVLDMKAIDTVRRQLSDAGTPGSTGAQGYAALKKQFATEMSKRLGKIQEDYVGEAQKALQATYHEGSEQIRGASGALSRKATAIDRVNPEEFSMDAKDIPKNYFKSAQKVQDLTQLIGEDKTRELGEAYLSRTLAGHDANYVENFLKSKDNTDWLRQVPGKVDPATGEVITLQDKGAAYLKELRRVEATTSKLESKAVQLARGGAGQKSIMGAADKESASIKAEFEAQAKAIQKKATARTMSLMSPASSTGAAAAGTLFERRVRNATTDWGSEDEESAP